MMYRYGRVQGILVRRYGLFRKIQVLPLLSLLGGAALLDLGLMHFFIPLIAICAGALLLAVAYFHFDITIAVMALMGALVWHWGFLRGMLQKIKDA